jgi:predicted TIM-barrel fold metal-dependent hydrolase
MVIIDAHTHVDESEALGWYDPPEKLIGLLDEAGISQAVIMAYHDSPGAPVDAFAYVATAAARYPERLVAFARLNPRFGHQAEDLLNQAITQHGMKGLKLHPVSCGVHPANPLTLRLIRQAARFCAPTLFHCGDEDYTLPWQIAAAAEECPEAVIILGHMGGYYHVEDAIAVARRYPNIYLETSAMPYPWRIKEAVMAVGAERVLFASDGPGCNPYLELQKLRRAGLSADEETLVCGENIRRLLSSVQSEVRLSDDH